MYLLANVSKKVSVKRLQKRLAISGYRANPIGAGSPCEHLQVTAAEDFAFYHLNVPTFRLKFSIGLTNSY
jgi:hypothetical protein